MRGKTGFDDFPGRVYVPFACYFGRLSVLCRTRDADLPERGGCDIWAVSHGRSLALHSSTATALPGDERGVGGREPDHPVCMPP